MPFDNGMARTLAEAHAMTLEPADLKARCVIYLILCTVNGKGYVGQTIGTINSRRFEHRRGFRDVPGGHRDHCPVLNAAFRKHGWENFVFYLVEVCSSREEMNAREAIWIAQLKTLAPDGYNLKTGGSAHSLPESGKIKLSRFNKGKKMSPETIEKTRQANISRVKSAEEIENIREGVHRRGYRHTPEAIELIRKSSTGRIIPRDAVERGAAKRRGRKHTEETRIFCAEIGRSVIYGPDHGEKVRLGMERARQRRLANGEPEPIDPRKGRPLSEEHKAKIGSSLRGKKYRKRK